MRVYKFGGASVKDAAGVRNVEKIVRLALNDQTPTDLMVVISAMGKTTNALERVVEFLDAGKEEAALNQWVDVIDFHVAIMKELKLQPGVDIRLQGEIPYDPALSFLPRSLRSICSNRDCRWNGGTCLNCCVPITRGGKLKWMIRSALRLLGQGGIDPAVRRWWSRRVSLAEQKMASEPRSVVKDQTTPQRY